MKNDLRVQWQLFGGVAAFVAAIDVVYWFVSYERAGTTMLALASGLAALCGGWLFVQDRRRPAADEPTISADSRTPLASAHDGSAHDRSAHEGSAHYLPTTSWWPLVIGVGMVLALNGLILSWPYAVPGGAVLILGIGGFVSDSRRRA